MVIVGSVAGAVAAILKIKGRSSKPRGLLIGYFDDMFEAICVRKSAELRYNYHPNHGI
jgi:hypothetical protein